MSETTNKYLLVYAPETIAVCYVASAWRCIADTFIEQICLPCLAPGVVHHQSRSLREIVSESKDSKQRHLFEMGQSTNPKALSDGTGGK